MLLLIFGCKDDECDSRGGDNNSLEPYIKNLILPDTKLPYIGSYYIHVNFKIFGTSEIEELTFSEESQNMSVRYYPSDSGLGMSIQGVNFSDSETSENLEISFYFNTNIDTTFNICYANYYFADPWRNEAGANIMYFKPVSDTDPSRKYMYLGINSSEYYFEITYIGNNRINGVFHTKWKECCGESITYDIYGDFSIPDIRYFSN